MEGLFPKMFDFDDLEDPFCTTEVTKSPPDSFTISPPIAPIVEAFRQEQRSLPASALLHPQPIKDMAISLEHAPEKLIDTLHIPILGTVQKAQSGNEVKSNRRILNHRISERRRRRCFQEEMCRLNTLLNQSVSLFHQPILGPQKTEMARVIGRSLADVMMKKPSKVQILEVTIDHIKLLQSALIQLSKESAQLENMLNKK